MPCILAIESSCDDTGAAILKNGKILSNVISSQLIHSKYGGVVPELASRDHQKNILSVVEEAIKTAGIEKNELDAVAFTRGPGLLGSLHVGISFAKAMAFGLDIPLIDVNHLDAHLLAHFIDDPKPAYPFLCLLVSGGHTRLVLLNSANDFDVLGSTIDDAAGEAFDKGAKIMGLPYPGGPVIDELAKGGNPTRFKFNLPKAGGLNYSFSGLKTALLYFLRDELKTNKQFIEENKADLCASWQHTIVKYLIQNLKLAIETSGAKHVGIAGGVAANSELRLRLEEVANEYKTKAYVPAFEYCLDNAAMIAQAALYKYDNGEFTDLDVAPFTRE